MPKTKEQRRQEHKKDYEKHKAQSKAWYHRTKSDEKLKKKRAYNKTIYHKKQHSNTEYLWK